MINNSGFFRRCKRELRSIHNLPNEYNCLNTNKSLFFVAVMVYQILGNKSRFVYGNRIRNLIVVTSITILLLYVILSDVKDVSAQQGVTSDEEFLNDFVGLTNKSASLTNSYQQEIGKWQDNQYSNLTVMMITNDTIAQINNLINEANNLQIPEKYKGGISLYTKSLEAERDSYKQFGDFIKTGNPELNETSTDLLSESLKYEMEAFKAIQPSQ
jgi:hypothetical protein